MRRGLLVLLVVLGGCYRYQPLGERPAPVPGTRVMVEFTDVGRVGMEPQIGPEVARMEGAVVAQSDSGYVVGVSAVIGLWGAVSVWQGERVSVRPGYIRRISQRRLSAGRTVAAAGGAVLGFVAFLATTSLLGGGNSNDPGREPPPPSGN